MQVIPLIPVAAHSLRRGMLVEESGRLYQIDKCIGCLVVFRLRFRFEVIDVETGQTRTLVRFADDAEAVNLAERDLSYLSRDDTANVLLDLETCEEFRVPLWLGVPAFSDSTPGDTLHVGFWQGRPVGFRRASAAPAGAARRWSMTGR